MPSSSSISSSQQKATSTHDHEQQHQQRQEQHSYPFPSLQRPALCHSTGVTSNSRLFWLAHSAWRTAKWRHEAGCFSWTPLTHGGHQQLAAKAEIFNCWQLMQEDILAPSIHHRACTLTADSPSTSPTDASSSWHLGLSISKVRWCFKNPGLGSAPDQETGAAPTLPTSSSPSISPSTTKQQPSPLKMKTLSASLHQFISVGRFGGEVLTYKQHVPASADSPVTVLTRAELVATMDLPGSMMSVSPDDLTTSRTVSIRSVGVGSTSPLTQQRTMTAQQRQPQDRNRVGKTQVPSCAVTMHVSLPFNHH